MSEPLSGIDIRKSTDDDWPQVLDLYNSLGQNDLEFRFMNLHHLTIEEAKQISQPKTHTTYLALKGMKVIGEAALEEDGEISVVVAKEFREGGVGVSLLKKLIEEAKLNGMHRLKFYCSPSNMRMAWLGAFVGFKVLRHYGVEDEWTMDL